MALKVHSSLLVSLLFFGFGCGCSAERDEVIISHSDGYFSHARQDLFRSGAQQTVTRAMQDLSGNICGGPTIRKLIGNKADHTSIRNVNWARVVKIADDYIAEQGAKVTQLTKDVQDLQERLKKQQKLEQFKPISKDNIVKLITPAIISGYGELGNAQKTLCGFKSIRSKDASGKRIRIGTYEQNAASTAAFKVEADKYFAAKKESVDADTFHATCMTLMNTEKADLAHTNCDEFCLELDTIAHAASDTPAVASGEQTAEIMSQKLEEKNDDLKFAMGKVSECERSKQNLKSFQVELVSLSDGIASTLNSYRLSQDEFDEADMAFEDLQDDLAKQDATTKQLQGVFAKNKKALGAAQAVYDQKVKQEGELKKQVAKTLLEMAKASAALSKASLADSAVKELKMAVSDTMLNMVVYFDEAVRAPVLNLGLGLETKVSDYFPDAKSMESSTKVASSVKSLVDLCKTDAEPHFKDMKDKVDLSPLCALGGSADQIRKGIDQAVSTRVAEVQKSLEAAQSLLQPYQGQKGMTLAKAQKRVADGEPKGLQEVKSVFQTAPFWKYLEQWQLEGTVLPLYKKLGVALKELSTTLKEADAAVKKTQNQLADMMAQSKQALQIVGKAVRSMKNAEADKAEAESALALLTKETNDQEKLVKKMKVTCDQALASYESAKSNLVQSHKNAVGGSMIETLHAAEIRKHMDMDV